MKQHIKTCSIHALASPFAIVETHMLGESRVEVL